MVIRVWRADGRKEISLVWSGVIFFLRPSVTGSVGCTVHTVSGYAARRSADSLRNSCDVERYGMAMAMAMAMAACAESISTR